METYYSLLKSHLAVQICTVSYVEYFIKFLRNYITRPYWARINQTWT